jgi:hypothetical protein
LNEGHEASWWELYIQIFEEVIDDNEERMESPALSTFKKMNPFL